MSTTVPTTPRGSNPPRPKHAAPQGIKPKTPAREEPAFRDGSLYVNEDASRFAADRSSGTVVVESDNPELGMQVDELGSAAARHLASGYAAACGVGDARINGNTQTYPVNDEGLPLDQVKDPATGDPLPQKHIRMQPAKFRADIPVCRKLI